VRSRASLRCRQPNLLRFAHLQWRMRYDGA